MGSGKRKKSPVERWLVSPDKHVPYQDRAAWNCLKRAIAIVKPDGYIDLGDFAEAESVSHWQWKKKKRPPLYIQIESIDREVATLNKWFDDLDEVIDKVGTKRKIFCQGNHDEWFDRMVEENDLLGRTRHDYGEGYRFENVVGLKKRGYDYFPLGQPAQIGKLYFYHGNHCRSALNHARWHLLNKGVNLMYGHWHDIQEYSISHVDGQKAAWSIGCLKSLRYEDANEWTGRRPLNWGHAFAIVDFFDNGLFTPHIIRIINGKCSLWGELIDGNKEKR